MNLSKIPGRVMQKCGHWAPSSGSRRTKILLSRAIRKYELPLKGHAQFCSGNGVAADQFGCDYLSGATLLPQINQDTPICAKSWHPPLMPAQLEAIRPQIKQTADALVKSLFVRDQFDAVTDLAQHLPFAVVRELIGLPDFGKENMLKWAAAAFNVLGIQNDRGAQAVADINIMRQFLRDGINRDTVKEGSWIRQIIDLVDEGKLDPELAPFAMRDFINPSLDTTISAIGQLIWQLGQNPDQWEKLKAQPDSALNAVHEAVRLGTHQYECFQGKQLNQSPLQTLIFLKARA